MFWNHGGGTRGLYKRPILKEFEFALLVYLSSVTVLESYWVFESLCDRSVCVCCQYGMCLWSVCGLWFGCMCMWWFLVTKEEVKLFCCWIPLLVALPRRTRTRTRTREAAPSTTMLNWSPLPSHAPVLSECLVLLNDEWWMSRTLSFVFGSLIDLIQIHSSGLGLDIAYFFSFIVLLLLLGFFSKFPCICS